MKRRAVIYPYKIGSESARELAKQLGTYCVYPDRKYRPRPNHIIIGWGAGVFPRWWAAGHKILNDPSRVSIASNKLRTFEQLARVGVRVPDFSRLRADAQRWSAEGGTVVCRSSLSGSEGRGITLCKGNDPVPEVPLYTKHIRHRREFRIHVFNGHIIDASEKKRRTDFPEEQRNSLLRNWRFGWVFAHENVDVPRDVSEQSISAIAALGLDFGAVDVGYREKEGQAFVFEVNTAPGIEGTTLSSYARAVQSIL